MYLLPLSIVTAGLAVGELLMMFRQRGHEPLGLAIYAGVLVTLFAAAVPGLWPEFADSSRIQGVGWIAVGLAAGILLVMAAEISRYEPGGQSTANLTLSVFAIVYIGGLVGFLIQLRLLGGDSGRIGMLALLSMIAIVKSSDIGQYTVGRLLGKNKLAPKLSPGKTWEGVFGGVLFALFAAWLMMTYAAPVILSNGWILEMWIGRLALYAVALVAVGIAGDLTESLLKRDAGAKDSSEWMPGFGGVLDLVDSLLVAAPVAYFFWATGLLGEFWGC